MDANYYLHPKFKGCYDTLVSNGNKIWQCESILVFHLPSFATQVAFMLFTTRFLYYLLRPFNQPRLIVEILVGFLISPEVIGKQTLYRHLVPVKSVLSTETISYVGLIYHVFLAGLDMNVETILRARKKPTFIAVSGTILPMILGSGIYYYLQTNYQGTKPHLQHVKLFNTPKAYLFWNLICSVTGFPIVTQVLVDLKLLYTGLGRVALTSSMITDFYNWFMFALLVPFALNERIAIYSVLSTILFVVVCFVVIRPYLVRIIEKKTNNNEWDNYQLFFVVMGAFVCAAITDILGTHPVIGALVYGIMLPHGKFSEMLVDKTEDFGAVYLAPLFFASVGIRSKIITLIVKQKWLVAKVLAMLCVPKILSTIVATQFFGMPALDGVAIGLIMNTKGILPLIMLNLAWDKEILSVETFSILLLSCFIMTALAPIMINILYKPRKLYKQNKLRTIQNLKVEAELRVLTCVHNPRQASGMLSILEACNAIKLSPLRVFALQLVELTTTSTSLLAAHINRQQGGSQTLTETEQDLANITNIFRSYAEESENTSVQTLAAVSTYSTIHQDIYNVAQEKQASLILLPFHKQANVEGLLETINEAYKSINHNVMRHAPCSVGIFVDRGLGSLSKVNLKVLMVFIGGPDDREALACAWRMSKHEGVQLSVVRIHLVGEAAEVDSTLQEEGKGLLSAVVDCERQKEMDDEYVNSFRLKAVNNEDSISYSEKDVLTRDDIARVLNELDQIGCDLYVLGQGAGRNSLVLSELMKWTDCPELGVIGDMVASNSFGSCSSLLVVQQYGFGGMVFENANKQPSQGLPDNDDGSGALTAVKVE